MARDNSAQVFLEKIEHLRLLSSQDKRATQSLVKSNSRDLDEEVRNLASRLSVEESDWELSHAEEMENSDFESRIAERVEESVMSEDSDKEVERYEDTYETDDGFPFGEWQAQVPVRRETTEDLGEEDETSEVPLVYPVARADGSFLDVKEEEMKVLGIVKGEEASRADREVSEEGVVKGERLGDQDFDEAALAAKLVCGMVLALWAIQETVSVVA